MISRGNVKSAFVLVLTFAACALAQQAPQLRITNLAELLELAEHPSVSAAEYLQAAKVLDALEPSERRATLERLISAKHYGMAADAAQRAISSGETSLISAIAERICDRYPYDQGVVIQAVRRKKGPFLPIPHRLLKQTLEKAGSSTLAPPFVPEPADAIGSSAILIAGTGDAEDRLLVRKFASMRPNSWAAWTAVARAGVVDPATLQLARRVQRDESNWDPVRVAAAVALANVDENAAKLALAGVSAFFDEYAGVGMQSLIVSAYTNPRSDNKALSMQLRFHTLTALYLLKDNAAKHLTLECMHFNNEFISGYCGLVAALRWPDEALKAGQGATPDNEYANRLALIAERHPNLETAASMKLTPDRLAAARKRVREIGLGVVPFGSMLDLF